MNKDWAESKSVELLSQALFSQDGFRFSIGITPLQPETFFANNEDAKILPERHRLLQAQPENYLHALERTADWLTLVASIRQWEPAVLAEDIKTLGAGWEPDFVVLARQEPYQVLGGCVSFPSGWSLPDKVGKSLFATRRCLE